MPALTLGFTGMDSSTETELRRAFEQALPATGGDWRLVPDTHADFVIVDMDSMYGPMSWLRLHAAGKQVVGLTAAARTQTPYRIGRPVDAAELGRLLREMGGGQAPEADEPTSVPRTEPTAAAPPAAAPASKPSGMTPSPQPEDQLPVELPASASTTAPELPSHTHAIVEPTHPANEPPSVAVGRVLPAAPTIEPTPVAPTNTADVKPAPVAEPAPPVPAPVPSTPLRSAEPKTLAEWLTSGRVRGRLRFAHAGTSVLIDADQRQYFGPSSLKPLAPLFQHDATLADFENVSADVWSAQTSALGEAQPLGRLVWYGALLSSQGALAPGFQPDERFRLTKWPQTEREFPKHFRIATAMMKAPAAIAEIAQASGVPEADVADFVNASLATGFAEPFREPEPEPETTKPGGLFGRLRGR